MVADQGSPPQRLLFGGWGDGPDAGADEADEGNVWARGVDDVADVGLRGGRVAGVEPVEDLLVARQACSVESAVRKLTGGTHIPCAINDAVWPDHLLLHPPPILPLRPRFKMYAA